MQISSGAVAKNRLCQRRSSFSIVRIHLPHHNVEFRRTPRKRLKPNVPSKSAVQFQRGGPSLRQPARKLPTWDKRQKLLRCPQVPPPLLPPREHSRLISPRCNCFEVK